MKKVRCPMTKKELKEFFDEAERLEIEDLKEFFITRAKVGNYFRSGDHFTLHMKDYVMDYAGVRLMLVKEAGKGNYKRLIINY